MRKREKEIYLDDCGIVSVPGSFASPPRKVTDALSLQSSAEDSGKETDGLRLSAIRRVFNSCDVRDVDGCYHNKQKVMFHAMIDGEDE